MFKPLAMVGMRVPVISDGYAHPPIPPHRDHYGIDILYRRVGNDPKDDRGSRSFYMPSDALVVAMDDGTVTSINRVQRGTFVWIQHATGPLAGLYSFYQHLISAVVSVGMTVRAGDTLGVPGFDPSGGPASANNPYHLHFGMKSDETGTWVDPTPYWNQAGYFPPQEGPGGDLIAAVSDAGNALFSRAVDGDIDALMAIAGLTLIGAAS